MNAPDLSNANRLLQGQVSVAEIICYLQSDCYLTKSSAAKYIDHRDERIIEDAIRRGSLKAFRIGKKVLIKKSDIEAWVSAGEMISEKCKSSKSDLQKLTDRALEEAKARVAARRKATG